MKLQNNYKKLSIIITLATLVTGCSKYTDIKTQGHLIPGAFSNYRYLLNGSTFINSGSSLVDYASDDVYYKDSSSQLTSLGSSDYYGYAYNSYKWSDNIFPITGSYYQDQVWNNLYNVVTYANVVIEEVPSVTDSSEAAKQELIAEAKVHRADAYFNLVQMYGKPYSTNTAATDLGVPLVLVETTTQPLVRASVSEVYAQILKDLQDAIPYLPSTQTLTILPTVASAYGELARTYLYMGNMDSANVYAEKALAIKSTLIDLSTITTLSAATYPIRINNPEQLLGKSIAYYSISSYSPYAMRLSNKVLTELGEKDLRYSLFTMGASTVLYDNTDTVSRFFTLDRSIGESRSTGPSVPEMMLIKAEYYARNGDVSNAMDWVNKLRVKRFKAADYTPLTAANSDSALKVVIEERDREFFCRSIRWWDMRRLKNDPNFSQTITRTVKGVVYTLDPNSNRYVFPISAYNLKLNPEIVPNP